MFTKREDMLAEMNAKTDSVLNRKEEKADKTDLKEKTLKRETEIEVQRVRKEEAKLKSVEKVIERDTRHKQLKVKRKAAHTKKKQRLVARKAAKETRKAARVAKKEARATRKAASGKKRQDAKVAFDAFKATKPAKPTLREKPADAPETDADRKDRVSLNRRDTVSSRKADLSFDMAQMELRAGVRTAEAENRVDAIHEKLLEQEVLAEERRIERDEVGIAKAADDEAREAADVAAIETKLGGLDTAKKAQETTVASRQASASQKEGAETTHRDSKEAPPGEGEGKAPDPTGK
jgi:hypothetical protein